MSRMIRLPRQWLLGVHLIIPLLCIVYVLDQLWLNEQLLPYLGLGSLLLPLYLLFFELPHIIASYLGFFDRAYIVHYWNHLVYVVPIIIISTIVLYTWSPGVVIILYLILTMYHVVRQQTGIALLLGAPRNHVHHGWAWIAVVLSALVYSLTLLASALPTYLGPYIPYVTDALFAAFLVLGLWYAYQTKQVFARWFVLATVTLFGVSFFFVVAGYIFLGFFAIRFVHDVTAFLFYTMHEHNRNSDTKHNVWYQVLARIPMPIYGLVVVISIVVAFLIRLTTAHTTYVFLVIITLGLIHYYLESIMWKRQSLHRQQINVH